MHFEVRTGLPSSVKNREVNFKCPNVSMKTMSHILPIAYQLLSFRNKFAGFKSNSTNFAL